MSTIQHLINGELVNDSGRTADVYNPSTGKVIHQVPLASRETIQQAIDTAKAAMRQTWIRALRFNIPAPWFSGIPRDSRNRR